MLHTVWFICLILFLFHPSTVSALGNETDYSALLKFKESISSDPFEVLTSWNGSINFCNWHGVTCSNQRVTELNLTGYHLKGFLSPYVGNLSFLRIISLENNSFSGNIPNEFSRLFRLEELVLTNNMLEGKFPAITNFAQLRNLSLDENHLVGQIPKDIGTLRKLERLQISVNNLTGPIPVSISNLSSLTFLSIAINHLEGNIPQEIGHLKNLTTLYLGGNNLSDVSIIASVVSDLFRLLPEGGGEQNS